MRAQNPKTETSETMKDPRNLREMAENRAEEIDEQWQTHEEHVKQKYLDRFRVKPKHALLIDCAFIIACVCWIVYYGQSASLIPYLCILSVMGICIYTFLNNVKEVLT